MADTATLWLPFFNTFYRKQRVSPSQAVFVLHNKLHWVCSIGVLPNQVHGNRRWDWLAGWLGKPTPRKYIRSTQRHWRERLMPWTAAATDRLARQMPVKALKKGLFSSCLSPFVLHHFSHSFLVFVFSFSFISKSFHYPLTWQEYIISAHSRKVVYLFIVEAIIYLKLLWRIM